MTQLKMRIEQDLRQAMKEKNAMKTGTLRMLLAAIKNREIENRGELSDDVVMKIVGKLIKQRTESAALFRKGSREELAKKEEAEKIFLQMYLP